MFKREAASLLEHPVVTAVAAEVGRSPAQVLVRWAIQRGTSVIPKSVTPSRIDANYDVFSWQLSDDHMEKLGSLQPQQRMLDGRFWLSPAGPYKTLEDLWDE